MLGRTNTGGGGGGGGLNFKVIPNPQPSTAKENTIWVDTDRINNYYFSATQPEGMTEYDVWFPVGTSSTVAFSATKKNPIMVYPLSAKQYVSGALVDKTAKSWQGGEWVDWIRYILKGNNLYDGWTASGTTQTMTAEANGMRVTRNGAHCAHNSNVAYDISHYSAVYLDYSELTNDVGVEVFVNTVKHVSGTTTPLATTQSPLGSASRSGTARVDLSGVKNRGKMYIAFAVYNSEIGSFLLESIRFE